MSTSVCMFVFNNCKYDSRVLKEAKTLSNAGYEVKVIAVLDSISEPFEERDGFRIVRVATEPIHYRLERKAKGLNPVIKLKHIIKLILLGTFFFFDLLSNIIPGILKGTYRINGVRFDTGKYFNWVDKMRIFLKELDYNLFNKGIRNYLKDKITAHGKGFLLPSIGLLILFYIYKFFYIFYILLFLKPVRYINFLYYKKFKPLLLPLHKFLSFLDYYSKSYKLVKKEPADILHANDLNTLPVAYLLKKRFKGVLVYDSHELYVERNTLKKQSMFIKFLLTKIESYLINHGDYVITVNHSIAKELEKRYRVNNIEVVMNAPERGLLKEGLSLRDTLDIPDNMKIVLYIGGITFNRGLEELIQSLVYIPCYVLILMGYGNPEYVDGLRLLASSSGVEKRVHFFGPVAPDDVTGYAACADMGVAPIKNVSLSYYYCSPNKLFEYIIAGIPVAGSDFPELKRVIDGYHLGKTFNPEEPKDIAGAIEYVLSDEGRYSKMRENARRASLLFNWENESKKLIEVYDKLTST